MIYVIVLVLIVLKIIFWTFYFYARSQRIRATQTQHRFLVVDTRHAIIPGRRRNTDQMIIIQNEHLPAHDHPVNPHANVVMPPAYDDVVRGGDQESEDCKPPSYDQIVQNPANFSIPSAESRHHMPGSTLNAQSGCGPSG